MTDNLTEPGRRRVLGTPRLCPNRSCREPAGGVIRSEECGMSKRNRQFAMFCAVAVAVMVAAGSLASASRWDDDQDQDEQGHRKFKFALWGDTPYSAVERDTGIPALIADINRS